MRRHVSVKTQNESSGIWETAEFVRRLKEERARLGANQTAFGALAGASLDSQNRYETGKHLPNAEYLARLALNGVDVLYILTGERTDSPILSPTASEMLNAFEILAPDIQDAALTVVRAMGNGTGARSTGGPRMSDTNRTHLMEDSR